MPKFSLFASFVILFSLLLTGCKTTEVAIFEGNGQVLTGSGGTKEIVEGIDIWSYGTPPRSYKVLAVINDERRASGLIGRSLMKELYYDLASAAIEHGGDAVIIENSAKETTGFANVGGGAYVVGNNVYSYGGSSVARKSNFSTSLIIKYMGQ